jgi:hypothetical protein
MNYQTMARFIIILGVVALAYGGIQVAVNQPEKFDRSKSKMTIVGRNDMGNYFDTQNRNSVRERNRKAATKYLIAGGVIIFLGIGVSKSGRKSEAHSETSPTTESSGVQLAGTKVSEAAASNLSDEQLMQMYNITYDGKKYRFQSYSYDTLSDAVNYAKTKVSA